MINFYEQFGEIGSFHCLGIDDLWGKTGLQLNIVKPIINKVSGCTDVLNYTKNCNTKGGNIMHIYGEKLFNYYNKPVIAYDNFYQYNNTIISSNYIQSILPEGYGHNISVRVIFETESDDKNLLSYSKPTSLLVVVVMTSIIPLQIVPIIKALWLIFMVIILEKTLLLIGSNMCNNISPSLTLIYLII